MAVVVLVSLLPLGDDRVGATAPGAGPSPVRILRFAGTKASTTGSLVVYGAAAQPFAPGVPMAATPLSVPA